MVPRIRSCGRFDLGSKKVDDYSYFVFFVPPVMEIEQSNGVAETYFGLGYEQGRDASRRGLSPLIASET
jgi:hypothetical protein